MNPPYGQETPKWMEKLAAHGDGIALVFSRTDTSWFHDYAAKSHAICFVRGRIRFIDQWGKVGGSPGTGSMLLAFGLECATALERSGLGLTVRIR